jgi:hypothetical protein
VGQGAPPPGGPADFGNFSTLCVWEVILGGRFGLTFAKTRAPSRRPSSSKRGQRIEDHSQIFGPGGQILVMIMTFTKRQERTTSARASLVGVLTAKKFSRLGVWEVILGSGFGLTFAKTRAPRRHPSSSKRGQRIEAHIQIFGPGGQILVMSMTFTKKQECTTSARASLVSVLMAEIFLRWVCGRSFWEADLV